MRNFISLQLYFTAPNWVSHCPKSNPEVKSQTCLSSFRISCKRALLKNVFFQITRQLFPICMDVSWIVRFLNNRIVRFHGRFVSMICNDKHWCFWCLFDKDRSVPIHTCNLRILVTEIFSNSKFIAPKLYPNILISTDPCKLQCILSVWFLPEPMYALNLIEPKQRRF